MNTERYQRQIVLPDFGVEGQEKLAAATVTVVGAGGLGVPVLQYLSGMGIGSIRIIDEDVISISNLQRQIMYRTEDIGKKKVVAAKEFIERLNPEVEVSVFDEMLTSDNAKNLISKSDVVVDCTDSIESRYLINDVCIELDIPFVYGALYRHEGHVSVFNYQNKISYRDVYPDDSAKVENCNEIGVLGVLPGIIGCYQAMETVKIITGVGDSLSGKLLVVDAMNTDHHLFKLTEGKSTTPKKNPVEIRESWLTWTELESLNQQKHQFIDIRSQSAYEAHHDDRFENIPLELLAGWKPEKEKDLVLVCQQGITTRQASAIIQAEFPGTVVHQMKGGYDAQ
jgi:adenylyltransferase/sulfurtransferase